MKLNVMLCSFLLFSLYSSGIHAAEELKLSIGISAWVNVFGKVVKPFEEKTGIRIATTRPREQGISAIEVYQEVDEGLSSGGSVGTDFKSWLETVQKSDYKIKNPGKMTYRVVGRDLLQVYLWKGGPTKLTQTELIDLFSGKIVNWKTLNGQDLPVTIITSKSQIVTEKAFVERGLRGHSIPPDRKTIVDNVPAMMKKIAETPGAIGFSAAGTDKSGITLAPTHPVIGRPVTLITLGKPDEKVFKLLNFIREHGGSLLGENKADPADTTAQ